MPWRGRGRARKIATGSSGQKRYIGEKGTGFKSLFKVGDVVHAMSGSYQFKLRDQRIGICVLKTP
jgi:hypothetical protein